MSEFALHFRPAARRLCGMTAILNHSLPALPWADPRLARLPGTLPVAGDRWFTVAETYAAQMAERDRLIASAAPVHALLPEAEAAAAELYDLTLDKLRATPGFSFGAQAVTRPDGVQVALQRAQPLLTLGRLLQEDLCLLTKGTNDEHCLTAAILCFPASWTLAEKLGRPMSAIHIPVPAYDANITKRVQRLLDAVRAGQPLWRMNHNLYANPDLFHPRTEAAPRSDAAPRYLRAEHQCLARLPQTGAILFSIHTYVMAFGDLAPEDLRSLLAAHRR